MVYRYVLIGCSAELELERLECHFNLSATVTASSGESGDVLRWRGALGLAWRSVLSSGKFGGQGNLRSPNVAILARFGFDLQATSKQLQVSIFVSTIMQMSYATLYPLRTFCVVVNNDSESRLLGMAHDISNSEFSQGSRRLSHVIVQGPILNPYPVFPNTLARYAPTDFALCGSFSHSQGCSHSASTLSNIA